MSTASSVNFKKEKKMLTWQRANRRGEERKKSKNKGGI